MSAAIQCTRGPAERDLNLVVAEAQPLAPSGNSGQRVGPSLALREVGYGYRPGRSLGYSLLVHLLVLPVILLFGRYALHEPSIAVKPHLDLSRSANVLVLPTLGGGTEGRGQTGRSAKNANKLVSDLRARSRRGFAYPGPQPMVSNPPRATLGIQTILQPPLENLPHLRRYVPLPNIVQSPPPVEARHKEPPIMVKSGGLALRRPADASVVAPKIKLPVASESQLAGLVESKPQLPQKARRDPDEASELGGVQRDLKGLLVLNAAPPPPDVSGKTPRAEARSLFAVSPAEATVIADPAAGAKAGGQASAAGSGSHTDIPLGDALAEITSRGSGTNHGSHGLGTGGDGGSGLGSKDSSGGTGRGVSAGPGLGKESGPGRGSGSGAGSAPGNGGFPGISIQGGRYGNENTGSVQAKAEPRHQTSYKMTIVSTSRSGGGLPDLGVFKNEKVYTVYLDMRANDEDPAPSWTLQYAVLRPPTDDPTDTRHRIQGTPTPPYATLKVVPAVAPEVLRKAGRQTIVASAIIDTSGKLEQVSIRQSPEAQLTGPLVEALEQWIFEPAHIDGQPVALKVLLGIRLAVSR